MTLVLPERVDIAVIGGGAAGIFAAIHAKTLRPEKSVIVLESSAKPLGKVRISGGGRCNVTHDFARLNNDITQLIAQYPRGGKALKPLFHRFGPNETVAWFRQHGVRLKTEADGRMFPDTDDSETIVQCLLSELKARQIPLYTQVQLKRLVLPEDATSPLHLVMQRDGVRHDLLASQVLLATGSNRAIYEQLEALGQPMVSPVPSLFTFHIADKALHSLSGLSLPLVEARLRFASGERFKLQGPLLITHWGVSGPVVLKLSAFAARAFAEASDQATLVINGVPLLTEEALAERLAVLIAQSPDKQCHNLVALLNASFEADGLAMQLPRRYFLYLLSRCDIDPEHRLKALSGKAKQRLIQALKNLECSVQGKSMFKEEFVTAGGVDLAGVDFKTMASRVLPGVYFAGELLDIDGVTGGFNFQNAWSTGYIAGEAMALQEA